MYFVGIIDILTDWTAAKRAEHVLKALAHPLHTAGVSCVPPPQYADRFERGTRAWFA